MISLTRVPALRLWFHDRRCNRRLSLRRTHDCSMPFGDLCRKPQSNKLEAVRLVIWGFGAATTASTVNTAKASFVFISHDLLHLRVSNQITK
jgi:hypothetical protein